jgi:CheY-like chemotaxis protein
MARILVIDDDPKTLELYREVLGGAGHEVLAAQDGLQGLARTKRNPALILVDLMLPNMNGYEFVKRVRAVEGHAATPIVVVSGVATGEWALRVGADRFLQKPVRPRELVALVEQLLGAGRATGTG